MANDQVFGSLQKRECYGYAQVKANLLCPNTNQIYNVLLILEPNLTLLAPSQDETKGASCRMCYTSLPRALATMQEGRL